MKPHLSLIRALSRLVPRHVRSDWTREWEAELLAREHSGRGDLFRRSLSSFWDALALQRRHVLDDLCRDVTYGFRMLRKNRVFTVTVILLLAVGIGANTALFSVIDALLLRKLPVRNPDELVLFRWTGPITDITTVSDRSGGNGSGDTFSYLTFAQFRDHNATLSDVFAFQRLYQATVIADGQAEIVNGQYVSGTFFEALGVRGVLGRTISPADDARSAAPVAVISHRYWQRRFGSQPDILGKLLTLNNVPFTVVGITAPDFAGTVQVDEAPDLFVAISQQENVDREYKGLSKPDIWWVWIMGRMKPRVEMSQVRANLEGILQATALEALRTDNPALNEPPRLRLEFVSGSRGLVDRRESYVQSLLILFGLGGTILLTACANVGSLLLARSAKRTREMTIRLAIGASRTRILRQMLAESAVLAIAGGACGVLLAYWGKDLLLRWGPWNTSTSVISLALDMRVLSFAAAVSVFTGVLFGLAPAVSAARCARNAPAARQTGIGQQGRPYLGRAMLIAQVALSVVLLIGAGLFVRTIANLHDAVSIPAPESVLQFVIDPTPKQYEAARTNLWLEEIRARIAAVPGVRSVAWSGASASVGLSDRKTGERFEHVLAPVQGNFFDAMGIPLLRGRTFQPSDDRTSGKVAIANEAFVRRYLRDRDPIGSMTAAGEVVGLVRDARFSRLREDVRPTLFVPHLQGRAGQVTFRVRTAGDAAAFIPAIREAVRQVDAHLPMSATRTLADQIEHSLARERTFAGLSTMFSALALILICVGMYALMANSVERRIAEIGVRIALGARRADVLRLVMGQGLLPVMLGVAVGVGIALAVGRWIATVLFGVSSNDAATIGVAATIIIGIAALASYLPARRASRLDPVITLRAE